LTQWYRDHGHPDLFSVLENTRETAALDHNILNDLSSSRREGAESRLLLDPWLAEYIELCVTDEVHHEIHDATEPELRRRLHAHASSFRRLAPPAGDWRPLEPAIAALIPAAQPADHRHLSKSLSGGADFFVTRDEDVLRGADEIAEQFGIAVLRPEVLISTLDQRRAAGTYEPAALQATAIEAQPAANVLEEAFCSAFLNYGAGERKAALLEIFRAAVAAAGRVDARVFADDGRLVGALFLRPEADRIEVPLLRVARRDRLGQALARQLLYLPRAVAAETNTPQVNLTDGATSAVVHRALRDEAYEAAADGSYRCTIGRGLIEDEHDPRATGDPPAVAMMERRQWPIKLATGRLPSYLVPVRAAWAAQLFETRFAEATLFGRQTHLGLSREHVYYRSPAASHGIHAPARILWYVTGSGPVQGESHVRAVSQLTEVVVGEWRTLYQRFARFGVYEERQVRDAANSRDCVMALRFVDTELLHDPLSLSTLRHLAAELGETFHPPMSPSLLSERMFASIYLRGSHYAR
jgi:hypothetical protein